MKVKYFLKIQSKLFLGMTWVLLFIGFVFVLVREPVGWDMFTYVFCLVPIFYTSSIFSQEVEHNREAFIFTSRTPLYSFFSQTYFMGWLFSQGIFFVLYLAAMLTGLENYWNGWFVVVVYSTFLSLLGLAVGIISKNTMLSYSVPIGYWLIQMMAGQKWNEKFYIISVAVNIELESITVWSNVLFLSLLILLLGMVNLWMLSKGENFRKKLMLGSLVLITIVVPLGYMGYELVLEKQEFWRQNEWRNIEGPEISLHYKNVADQYAVKFADISNATAVQLKEKMGIEPAYNNFFIWYGDWDMEFPPKTEGSYRYCIRLLRQYNPIGKNGEDWAYAISSQMLTPILKNVEDQTLREEWKRYIFKMYIIPGLKRELGAEAWVTPYVYDRLHSQQQYIKSIEKVLYKEEYELWDNIYAAGAILYRLDQEDHAMLKTVLHKISKSDTTLTNNKLEQLFKKHFDPSMVSKLFAQYQEARIVREKYITKRWIREKD